MPSAIDTNVVLRFLLQDDARQAETASALVRRGVFVSLTVLLETAWVLRSTVKADQRDIAHILLDFIDLPEVHVSEPRWARWALESSADGADIADMVHLIEAREQGQFATFDRSISRKAGAAAPVRVETLR